MTTSSPLPTDAAVEASSFPLPSPVLPPGAELIVTPDEIRAALKRLSREITEVLAERRPLILAVMRGGVVFAGQLLPMLPFLVDFDYVDASRYGDATSGGELQWRVDVPTAVRGRVVLVLDDILDEGRTLAAIRERLLAAGASEVLIAVFADKRLPRSKPVSADFAGVSVPDRYVFGFGMDVRGEWRNLPAVYALREG